LAFGLAEADTSAHRCGTVLDSHQLPPLGLPMHYINISDMKDKFHQGLSNISTSKPLRVVWKDSILTLDDGSMPLSLVSLLYFSGAR
jgi:hypothetical protein